MLLRLSELHGDVQRKAEFPELVGSAKVAELTWRMTSDTELDLQEAVNGK